MDVRSKDALPFWSHPGIPRCTDAALLPPVFPKGHSALLRAESLADSKPGRRSRLSFATIKARIVAHVITHHIKRQAVSAQRTHAMDGLSTCSILDLSTDGRDTRLSYPPLLDLTVNHKGHATITVQLSLSAAHVNPYSGPEGASIMEENEKLQSLSRMFSMGGAHESSMRKKKRSGLFKSLSSCSGSTSVAKPRPVGSLDGQSSRVSSRSSETLHNEPLKGLRRQCTGSSKLPRYVEASRYTSL